MLQLLFPFIAVLLIAPVRGDVVPASLFSDGAILQREKPIPVWGRADPGEKVSVTFAGRAVQTTAGANGNWIVYLEALPASSQGADLVVAGRNTVTARDVLVGEVWLCSGQSNMEFPVSRAADAEREIAAANAPLIRHVKIDKVVADSPAGTVATNGWKAALPANVGDFTAVGYFFAREIQRKVGVPVGLINSSWGGTPVEAWMSPAAIASNPAFSMIGARWAQTLAEYPAAKADHDAALASWTSGEEAAKARGAEALAAFRRSNRRPAVPRGPGSPWTPAGLFNGMIHPLLPYALRGVLWYQGEANSTRPQEYHPYFAAMITAWRGHFGQGDIPFFWVNLANFKLPADSTGMAFAFVRESQTRTLSLPNTGQALAIDIGDPDDIHPTNKQEVGRRLALLAKNRVYGIIGDDTGPTYAGTTRVGSALRVRFTHAASGLTARGKPVQSLELAGANKVFHPATGRIERDALIVESRAVPEPVAVRYAWKNSPEANLYNGAGLPAVPFRSDNW